MKLPLSILLFKEFIGTHRLLFDAMTSMHEQLAVGGQGHQGHGIDHDLLVMGYALRIAPTKELAELAWIAASLHSLDRHFGEQAEKEISRLLELTSLNNEKRQTILTAVMRHDKKNAADDSMVQILLQDADRLANINPSVLIRSGQFRPTIPALEISEQALSPAPVPGESYQNPPSCIRDISKCLEWWPEHCEKYGVPKTFCIRTKAALRLAVPHFRALVKCFTGIRRVFNETGLFEIFQFIG